MILVDFDLFLFLCNIKAIKIPHTALLDVFGRSIAISSQDLNRLSYSIHSDKSSSSNDNEQNNKGTNPATPNNKPNNNNRLTVIGWLIFRIEKNKTKMCFHFFKLSSGETPLHIAIFYNDISSVQLLVKHGFDVNKRVIGDFYPNGQGRNKIETKNGKPRRDRGLFHRKETSNTLISLKNADPESTLNVCFIYLKHFLF